MLLTQTHTHINVVGMSHFFSRLETLMIARGVDQTTVEKAIKLPHGRITKWKEKADPKASHLIGLANYFDVSADWLLGLSEDEDRQSPLTRGECQLLSLIKSLGLTETEAIRAVARAYRERDEGETDLNGETDRTRKAL